MTRYYRCADRVPLADDLIAYSHGNVSHMAVLTGEYRPPRAGEWYVSGAIPEAYRMPNDGTMPHHIARLIVVRRREVIEPID